jgi:HSP20 family molecular chaperone IbpA
MLMPRRRDFDLFGDMFDDPFFTNNDSKMMKTDIKENDNNFELEIDLPGFKKDDIKMSIDDGYLTINAKQEDNKDEKDKHGKYVRRERYFGECSRSFYVGDDIKEEDIKAKYKNGTLRVEIPKKEEKEKLPDKKYIEIEG